MYFKRNNYLNKTIFILFLFISCFSNGYSQSSAKGFKKLSSPEKWWVILHPFKAKRAYKISLEANRISDSISKTNLLDNDKNGGQVDAFRHSYWMATLAQRIGRHAAKSLGKAHEKGNYKHFKKEKLEDGTIPDKPSSEMDLYNNTIGIEIYKENKKACKREFIKLIVDQINQGKLKIIKKNINGDYVNCEGVLLSKNEYYGKWENSKCIITSKKD